MASRDGTSKSRRRLPKGTVLAGERSGAITAVYYMKREDVSLFDQPCVGSSPQRWTSSVVMRHW